MKLLKSTGKELRFGFGLNTKAPENSTLLLARKGQPERLQKMLKSSGDFSNRLITYGIAKPDPQNGKVLIFQLTESAGEPPQILKLGRRFLRSDNNLKFRKLKLVLPGGREFEDQDPDPEDREQVAAAGGASGGAEYFSSQEEEEFIKSLETFERRVDQLINEQQVRV
jgi:hypothetical protein